MKDAIFEVVKPIPLGNGSSIPKGTRINRTHDVYYMEGNLLPKDYQEDFNNLILKESNTKWNYLVELKSRVMYKNSKEDI